MPPAYRSCVRNLFQVQSHPLHAPFAGTFVGFALQAAFFVNSGKTNARNVLDKFPKVLQAKAKGKHHDQFLAPTREQALMAFDLFVESFGEKYPKARRP